MKTYPLHPYCAFFPQAHEDILDDMASDIYTNGQTDPIVLHEGQVLDGRNRQLACEMARVEPLYVEYKGNDPLGFVISKNLNRRHLNDSQRTMLSQQAYKIRKLERLNKSTEKIVEEIAEQFNVTERGVRRASRVADVASSDVQKKIVDGDVSIKCVETAMQPSVHPDGTGCYEYAEGKSFDEIEIAELPETWRKAILKSSESAVSRDAAKRITIRFCSNRQAPVRNSSLTSAVIRR